MDDRPVNGFGMLTEADMPSRFHEANQMAIRAQRRFLLIVRVQIASLVVPVFAGAVAATVSGQDWLTYIALVGLIVVAATRLIQRFSGDESVWHSERATAESIRSLTWLYAAGGRPFDTVADDQAEVMFHDEVPALETDVGSDETHGEYVSQVTAGMRELRSASFEARRTTYATGRLADQRSWYSNKADSADARGRWWDILFVTSSAFAIVFGVLHVSGLLDINLISVFGILAAVIGTWTGVRQFGSISTTYSNAVVELVQLEHQVSLVDESRWGAFVSGSEEVMSREHRAWRVKRH
jgi:hypothetical protein